MSDQLSKFQIFEIISEKFNKKLEIKSFHIYKRSEKNVLFITSDDKVYGFGSNFKLCCDVNEPQLIPELSHKKIKQFFIGSSFALALTSDQQVFGWGRNQWGQLGRGTTTTKDIYSSPEIIDKLNGQGTIDLCCGQGFALALTSSGSVFGWGNNKFGQAGIRSDVSKIDSPTQIIFQSNSKIKSIYCSLACSYALTENGQVYSWGHNKYCNLGHDLDKNSSINEPKLILNISNVMDICCSVKTAYFLADDGINGGLIYFCGQYKNEQAETENETLSQNLPKKLETKIRFFSLKSTFAKKKVFFGIPAAISEQFVHHFRFNSVSETDYKNYNDFYSQEYEITYKTIQLEECAVIGKRSIVLDQFEEIAELGRGGFGTVFKMKSYSDNNLYAIKKITPPDEFSLNEILEEVKILKSCQSDFVVKCFDAWQENGELYIQMELCKFNLSDIIEEKSNLFRGKESKAMNPSEYFISCQLFKELLECVKYLHESNPPIIHRDLKPSNILMVENPVNNRFLKLCDFGLAKFQTITNMSHTLNMGTNKYMAPEIVRGPNANKQYNTKVDIYSLGIIGEELFELDIDSSSDNIINKNEILSDNWRSLEQEIDKMLHRKYDTRPTCADILSDSHSWILDQILLEEFQFEDNETEENIFKQYFKSRIN